MFNVALRQTQWRESDREKWRRRMCAEDIMWVHSSSPRNKTVQSNYLRENTLFSSYHTHFFTSGEAKLASCQTSCSAPVLVQNNPPQWRTGDLPPFPEEPLEGNLSEIPL